MRGHVDEALAAIGGGTQAELSERIVYATERNTEAPLLAGFAVDARDAGAPFGGMIIDRMQHIHELGYLCDPLTGWETCPPRFLAYEPEYANFTSDRQDTLYAAGAVTEITVYDDHYLDGSVWGTGDARVVVELPDATTMASFDTLEFDLHLRCVGHPELANCPAWDYLVYLFLCDEDDPATADVDESDTCDTEIGRWITTYWRPGRWVHDVTPYLALLQEGGTRKFAFYTSQPYQTDLKLRLSNQGKGMRPVALEPLYTGGYLGDTYNSSAVHSFDESSGLWAIRVFDGDSDYETEVSHVELGDTGGFLVGENPRRHPYGRNAFSRMDVEWGADALYWCPTTYTEPTEADAVACESTTCTAPDHDDLTTGCNGGAWRTLTPEPGTSLGSLGGEWREIYNSARLPMSVEVPDDLAAVSLMAVITGHGGATGDNCAEFCDHQHTFALDSASSWTKDHPMVGDLYGCANQVSDGTVPNQAGTWVYGRGGWCPGMEVDPWEVDVSAELLDGDAHELSYLGLVNGAVRRRGGSCGHGRG